MKIKIGTKKYNFLTEAMDISTDELRQQAKSILRQLELSGHLKDLFDQYKKIIKEIEQRDLLIDDIHKGYFHFWISKFEKKKANNCKLRKLFNKYKNNNK